MNVKKNIANLCLTLQVGFSEEYLEKCLSEKKS